MAINPQFFKNKDDFEEYRYNNLKGIHYFITTELEDGEILATIYQNPLGLPYSNRSDPEEAIQNALIQVHASVLSRYTASNGFLKGESEHWLRRYERESQKANIEEVESEHSIQKANIGKEKVNIESKH